MEALSATETTLPSEKEIQNPFADIFEQLQEVPLAPEDEAGNFGNGEISAKDVLGETQNEPLTRTEIEEFLLYYFENIEPGKLKYYGNIASGEGLVIRDDRGSIIATLPKATIGENGEKLYPTLNRLELMGARIFSPEETIKNARHIDELTKKHGAKYVATKTGFGKQGNEKEAIQHVINRETPIAFDLPPSSQNEFQAQTIESATTVASTSSELAVASAQIIIENAANPFLYFLSYSGFAQFCNKEDIGPNNGKLKAYIEQMIETFIGKLNCDDLDSAAEQFWFNLLKDEIGINLDESPKEAIIKYFKNNRERLTLLTFLVGHTNNGAARVEYTDIDGVKRFYADLQLLLDNANIANTPTGAIDALFTMSSPMSYGEKVELEVDDKNNFLPAMKTGMKRWIADVRLVARRLLFTTKPIKTLKLNDYVEEFIRVITSGEANRAGRAVFPEHGYSRIRQALGIIKKIVKGSEPSYEFKNITRSEKLQASGSDSPVGESYQATIQMIEDRFNVIARSEGQSPQEYLQRHGGIQYDALNPMNTRRLEDLINIGELEDPLVREALKARKFEIKTVKERYPNCKEIQKGCMIAELAIKINTEEEVPGHIRHIRDYNHIGPMQVVLKRMIEDEVPNLEIMQELHKFAVEQAQLVIKFEGDIYSLLVDQRNLNSPIEP